MRYWRNFGENRKLISRCGRLTHGFTFALHYDVSGEEKGKAKECMKMALRMCPSFGNGGDIVHTLPMLHMVIETGLIMTLVETDVE
jgi:hypothetical protein